MRIPVGFEKIAGSNFSRLTKFAGSKFERAERGPKGELQDVMVFRTAAMMLFDPQLVLLGQSAYVILDNFGKMGYILWALFYPVGLGTVCAWFGYVIFKRSDLPWLYHKV